MNEADNKSMLEFEERQKKPMTPDLDKAAEQIKKEFPVILKKCGIVITTFFTLMYLAIGFQGVLTFVLGMLSVIILIGVAIFLYIVNENERARALKEELEK